MFSKFYVFKNTGEDLTEKQLKSGSDGSGVRKPELLKITPAMHDSLLEFMVSTRGCAPPGHKHASAESLVTPDGLTTPVWYDDLVKHLCLTYPKEFDAVHPEEPLKRDKVWYKRVLRWCATRGKITRRVMNKVTPVSKTLQASRVEGTLDELRKAQRPQLVKWNEYANLDETSLRILALTLITLHWVGAKHVPKTKTNEKLCLSTAVMWWSSGRMECVVLHKRKRKKATKMKWENKHGVWWLICPSSKWTKKDIYPELLSHFFRLGTPVKIFLDDMAKGHGGTMPDNFLKTMGVRRIRIQGGCTSVLQPADRPLTNQKLKELLRVLLRQKQIQDLRNGTYQTWKSLTLAAEEAFGKILAEVSRKMNEEHAQGIRQAFGETVCRVPGVQEHSELTALRAYAKENNLVPVYDPFPDPRRKIKCPHGCGHTWATFEKRTKDEKHFETSCWYTRERLLPPLLPETEPGESPDGLVVEWKYRGEKKVAVVCKGFVRSLDTRRKVKSKFWKENEIKFRRPRQREFRQVQELLTKFKK